MVPNELFSDSENNSDPHADAAFGNNAEVMNDANAATNDMTTSESMTGQAYRTMTQSEIRARLDMSSDPMWASTDAAIAQALSGDDSNCTIVTGTGTTTTTTHVPDYQVCERIAYPSGSCNFYHDYTVDLWVILLGPWVSATETDSTTVTINVQTGSN